MAPALVEKFSWTGLQDTSGITALFRIEGSSKALCGDGDW
jgi:hypothetical protein